jgi:hypothetical protein
MSGLLPQTLQDSSDIFSRASGDATRRRSALEASHTGSDNQGTNLRRQKRSGTKRKPSRWILSCYNRCTPLNTVVVTLALVILSWLPWIGLWLFRHAQCYSREAFVSWGEAPIHDAASGIHRVCPKVPYTTLSNEGQSDTLGSDKSKSARSRICMTTLTDQAAISSWWQRSLRCRDFDQVGPLTLPNQQAYADRHGYVLIDGSDVLDVSRPPAWSKIPAVLRLLRQEEKHEPNTLKMRSTIDCDWVWWLDADVVIMNSSIALEESLLPQDPNLHLIVTPDRRLTVNSGSWLIRNDPWSHTFLESWWNQTSFVREPGLSLSGDNAAFGNLVARLLDDPEQSPHISIIPKCQLNSFGAFVPEKPHVRRPLERDEPIGATQIKWSTSSISIQQEEWYRSPLFYHAGDFVAHASGMDQKAAGVAMLLARAE